MDAFKNIFAIFVICSTINCVPGSPYNADEQAKSHQILGKRFGSWTKAISSPRECSLVDSTMPRHTEAVYNFGEQLQQAPNQVEYCDGEHPFWRATWSIYETQPGWQKYATGTFRYIDYDNNAHTAHIRIKWQVENIDTNEIMELDSDITLLRVIALYDAAKALYPNQKLHSLKHTMVKNGGTWSAKNYGFQLKMLDPPEFLGGSAIPFVIDCESECVWGPSRFQFGRSHVKVFDAQSKYTIQLTHIIDLDSIAEIVSAVRLHIHADDRITSVKYVSVANGGSWSEETYGYVVKIAQQPGYGRGYFLRVKKDCSIYPCEWTTKRRGAWVR